MHSFLESGVADATQARAHEIWQHRQENGTAGTEVADWLEAEKELSAADPAYDQARTRMLNSLGVYHTPDG
jgi:hypothetical protein